MLYVSHGYHRPLKATQKSCKAIERTPGMMPETKKSKMSSSVITSGENKVSSLKMRTMAGQRMASSESQRLMSARRNRATIRGSNSVFQFRSIRTVLLHTYSHERPVFHLWNDDTASFFPSCPSFLNEVLTFNFIEGFLAKPQTRLCIKISDSLKTSSISVI